MNKIISDESLRCALAHLAPAPCKYGSEEKRAARAIQLAKSTEWMDKALGDSTQESLRTSWILDADTSVKLLYGHQAGAEIGYNPTKPGRFTPVTFDLMCAKNECLHNNITFSVSHK
ncbi:hypothetical protein [Nitrosomonas sp.]|uniref:hypothetical protein n=1 Tax=Nitrosomonas sp. TaxID=42353 RepID=UPI0025DEE0C5|nr:hypothetical protein [Nitrosomonas sp.]